MRIGLVSLAAVSNGLVCTGHGETEWFGFRGANWFGFSGAKWFGFQGIADWFGLVCMAGLQGRGGRPDCRQTGRSGSPSEKDRFNPIKGQKKKGTVALFFTRRVGRDVPHEPHKHDNARDRHISGAGEPYECRLYLRAFVTRTQRCWHRPVCKPKKPAICRRRLHPTRT